MSVNRTTEEKIADKKTDLLRYVTNIQKYENELSQLNKKLERLEQSGKPNEEQTMIQDDVNHFDPEYFKGKQWHLADLEGSELAYLNTKFLFERNNRKIFDATLDGKLQVFDKIPFSEALSKAMKE